ncbi:MAG: 2OG-Fe(II) oxygenase [Proteobacteria bacterium]|nr:MAG: 2OG-Fe(II) oxygenase [Pseudomonadota bacterium]
MLTHYLQPIEINKCNSWLEEITQSDHWLDSHVIERKIYQRGTSRANATQRNASVLARENCKDVYEGFEQYLASISYKLADAWGICPNISWEGTQIVRYKAGGFFVPHRDSSDLFPERVITVIAYLNDDFNGGETSFLDMETDITPKQGAVVSFPSDLIHSAKPVLSGAKYIFVTWATIEQVDWI